MKTIGRVINVRFSLEIVPAALDLPFSASDYTNKLDFQSLVFSIVEQSSSFVGCSRFPFVEMNRFVSLALLALIFAVAQAHVFRCLDDGCLCDTDEELISCHNNGTRTEVPLPAKRLRGFVGIDVIGNPNFDCDQIQEYKRIHILSSCGNETQEYANVEVYMPTEANTVDCDPICQAKKHAETAHEYMKELWQSLLEKIQEIREHEFVKEVETSVKGVANDFVDWLRHHTK
ncbi:hypothetical protein M3Y94_00745900 [Aphelenchoides besseyi]|nr:hypothetical protein M3Y94_00745900 [Aphelenchoides besseyi]